MSSEICLDHSNNCGDESCICSVLMKEDCEDCKMEVSK